MAVIAIVSFGLMFLMNSNTPYVAEDFDYHYIFALDGRKVTDELISSFADIVTSIKAHYQTMNGRIITHSIVQLIMMFDNKAVFNVLNSAVYILFAFLVYKNCKGKSKNPNALLFLFVNLSVWAFVPQWGLTTVWLLGSVNYMWMSCIRLLTLLVFRFYADDGTEKHTILKTVGMLFLGFVAGNSSENMSAALVFVTVLFLIYYRIKHYKFRPWFISSLVGQLAGYALMFFAPANNVRVSKFSTEGGSTLASRIVNIPANAIANLAPIVLVGVVFILIIVFEKRSRSFGISFICAAGAVAGAGVMLFIPAFPPRAWFGIIVYMIIAVGNLFCKIDFSKRTINQIVSVAAIFCVLWSATSYLKAFNSSREYMSVINERVEYIEEQKQQGNYDLEFANITLLNKHAPLYSWTDIGRDENDPQHISIAQYFGLNSVDWNGESIIIE